MKPARAWLLLPVASTLHELHDAGLPVARHWVAGPRSDTSPPPFVARTAKL